jgi:hypothetical protein
MGDNVERIVDVQPQVAASRGTAVVSSPDALAAGSTAVASSTRWG